ncbi:MAG: hypothetical protein SGI86_07245 [Deltaproteobacteria bacterium]|nr:hypothetical protein [Deltaproteobacteria bacterium]
MKFGAEDIQETAAKLGFRSDALEKVFRLLSLLETLRSNTFLRGRIALKGGTALNLFLLAAVLREQCWLIGQVRD